MHRDGIEVDAGAGCSFLTIGKFVKASLGGGGDRRRTSTALNAGLRVTLSIFPSLKCLSQRAPSGTQGLSATSFTENVNWWISGLLWLHCLLRYDVCRYEAW
jgi:hypothetical protein